MKKLLILTFFVIASISGYSKQTTYGDILVSKVVDVYDGDTFKVNIIHFPPIIGEAIPIRIANIDTPELTTKNTQLKILAYQAKEFTANKLKNGHEIILKNMKRGKYFRIVAEVWIDGENLADELMKKGLAKPYFGGKKTEWE